NTIDDGIASPATCAANALLLALQRSMADGADDPAEIFRRDRLYAHPSILTICHRVGRILWPRYHEGDDKYSTNFGWRRDRRADQGRGRSGGQATFRSRDHPGACSHSRRRG